MPRVFADWRCSQAILDFLAHTEVGRSYPKPDAGDRGTDSDSEDSDSEDDDDVSEDTGEPTVEGSSGNTEDDDGQGPAASATKGSGDTERDSSRGRRRGGGGLDQGGSRESVRTC